MIRGRAGASLSSPVKVLTWKTKGRGMSQEQWFFKGEKIRGQRNPAALKKRDFDRDDELALIHPDCGDQRGAVDGGGRKRRGRSSGRSSGSKNNDDADCRTTREKKSSRAAKKKERIFSAKQIVCREPSPSPLSPFQCHRAATSPLGFGHSMN